MILIKQADDPEVISELNSSLMAKTSCAPIDMFDEHVYYSRAPVHLNLRVHRRRGMSRHCVVCPS